MMAFEEWQKKSLEKYATILSIVLISVGNLEISAQVLKFLGAGKEQSLFFICLWHLIAVTNKICILRKRFIFLHAGATCSELPSNISTLVLSLLSLLFLPSYIRTRVLILDGSSEHGLHIWSKSSIAIS